MICHVNKFIFVHIPKCGGTTIENIFNGWHKWKTNDKLIGENRQHYKLTQILELNPSCNNYFRFTFIRNPYDRIVSEYHYLKRKFPEKVKITFKEFCADLDRNLDLYAGHYHKLTMVDYFDNYPVDFIGRVETMQRDWDVICELIGIPFNELKKENTTKHKHYTEYYDDETRQIVADKYSKDLEYFGYEFQPK